MQLYKISFTTTLKVYIGITTRSIEHRFKEHCYSNMLIGMAIRKHGIDNCVLSTLAECDDWELLCLAEQEAIEKYKSKKPNGYNLTDGGDGVLGLIHSEESKKIMSESQKKTREEHPEIAQKISETLKLFYKNNPEENSRRQKIRFESQEERNKSRDRLKKYFKNNPAAVENVRARMLEMYKNEPERKKVITESLLKRFSTQDSLDRHSISMKNRIVKYPDLYTNLQEKSKEYYSKKENRDKMSAIKNKYYSENPQVIIAASEKSKKQWESLENRQRMSEIKKEFHKNNPDAAKRQAEKNREHYKNNPIARVKASVMTHTKNAEKKELLFSMLQKDYFDGKQ